MKLPLSQSTPLQQDESGTVRIAGSRVTLDTVVRAFFDGATAEQIHDSFPSVSLRDVYATIAFFLEHESAVREYLKERSEASATLRREIEARQDSGLGARLRARRSNLTRP